jgi:hypothetical protein
MPPSESGGIRGISCHSKEHKYHFMPRIFFAILVVISFSACQEEDPGPRQQGSSNLNKIKQVIG